MKPAHCQTKIIPNSGKPVHNARGFSLIEVLVTLTLLGIMAAITAMGYSYVLRHQIVAASQRLFGDLQKLRQDAMTQGVQGAGLIRRGFGIRFDPNGWPAGGSQYILFQFNDVNNDFVYDGDTEELNPTPIYVPSSVTISDPDGVTLMDTDVLIYDSFGIARNVTWGLPSIDTMVLKRTGVTQMRCIVVSLTRLREGPWDGTTCA